MYVSTTIPCIIEHRRRKQTLKNNKNNRKIMCTATDKSEGPNPSNFYYIPCLFPQD